MAYSNFETGLKLVFYFRAAREKRKKEKERRKKEQELNVKKKEKEKEMHKNRSLEGMKKKGELDTVSTIYYIVNLITTIIQWTSEIRRF